MKLLAVLAPVAKTCMLCNRDRFFNDFNLLNHTASVFNEMKNAAAVRASVKGVRLTMIDLIECKRHSLMLGVSGLSADFLRDVTFCFWRRFDNIRGWRLGRIGRVFREFGDLVGEFGYLFNKFSVDFEKLGNLFFKLRDALNVKLFCFNSQVFVLKPFAKDIIGRTRPSA